MFQRSEEMETRDANSARARNSEDTARAGMYAAAIEKNPLMLSRKNLRSSSRGSDQRCGHCPCSDGGPLFLTLPPLRTGCVQLTACLGKYLGTACLPQQPAQGVTALSFLFSCHSVMGERGSCAPARRGKRLEETGHTLPGIWPNSASMVWRRLLTGAGLAWAASSVLNVYLICRCVWQGAARGRMRWLWACMTKAD